MQAKGKTTIKSTEAPKSVPNAMKREKVVKKTSDTKEAMTRNKPVNTPGQSLNNSFVTHSLKNEPLEKETQETQGQITNIQAEAPLNHKPSDDESKTPKNILKSSFSNKALTESKSTESKYLRFKENTAEICILGINIKRVFAEKCLSIERADYFPSFISKQSSDQIERKVEQQRNSYYNTNVEQIKSTEVYSMEDYIPLQTTHRKHVYRSFKLKKNKKSDLLIIGKLVHNLKKVSIFSNFKSALDFDSTNSTRVQFDDYFSTLNADETKQSSVYTNQKSDRQSKSDIYLKTLRSASSSQSSINYNSSLPPNTMKKSSMISPATAFEKQFKNVKELQKIGGLECTNSKPNPKFVLHRNIIKQKNNSTCYNQQSEFNSKKRGLSEKSTELLIKLGDRVRW